MNEGYSTVADLAAGRCDGREGVALLGPEQLVSPLCSGCRWRLLGLRAPPCGERAGSPLGSSFAPATEREVKLLWSKGQRKMRAEMGGGRSGEGVLVLGDEGVRLLWGRKWVWKKKKRIPKPGRVAMEAGGEGNVSPAAGWKNQNQGGSVWLVFGKNMVLAEGLYAEERGCVESSGG